MHNLQTKKVSKSVMRQICYPLRPGKRKIRPSRNDDLPLPTALERKMQRLEEEHCAREEAERAAKRKPKRSTVGKRLRFEVMKRDGFKCRYCGATAATTLLHVDHVVPVAEGGTSDPANLVTACQSCNGGKSSIRLEESRLPETTPTEDLIEHAEQMRSYLDAVKEREAAFDQMAAYVLTQWDQRIGYSNYDVSVSIRTAVAKVGLDLALEAVLAVARAKVSGVYDRNKYFNGVIRNMQKRLNGEAV